jgi:hypothetical protein
MKIDKILNQRPLYLNEDYIDLDYFLDKKQLCRIIYKSIYGIYLSKAILS